jgi:large subunit ribosomal protein L6
MSRIAKAPVNVPTGVEVVLQGQDITVKKSKTALTHKIHDDVEVKLEDNVLTFAARKNNAVAITGTTRSLINNMVVGVDKGFEKKLILTGVGYRAQAQGNNLNLTLGFSHPVNFAIPEGITIETPTQTEVVVKGADKQQVGQVAANIRSYREPEPYKGKGIRYADEVVVMKEAKKK